MRQTLIGTTIVVMINIAKYAAVLSSLILHMSTVESYEMISLRTARKAVSEGVASVSPVYTWKTKTFKMKTCPTVYEFV